MGECLCPICLKSFPLDVVDEHVDACLKNVGEVEFEHEYNGAEDADREYALRLMAEEDEERKMREDHNHRLLLDFLKADKRDTPPVNEAPSFYMCVMCLESYSLDDLHFLDCTHSACKKCLHKMIMSKIKELRVSQISCKECGAALSTPDIKELLSDEEYSSYESASMQELLDTNNSTYKRCPNLKCNNVLELMKSQLSLTNSSEVGPDGSPLSPEAIRHKQEYRFRCYECNTAFCSGCNTNPYHLGYNCEQFKAFQQALHCRFCNAQLTAKNTRRDRNAPVAFQNMCNLADCKMKRDASCDKMLKCAHFCCGVKNETTCLPCLHPNCVGPTAQRGDDFCNICWVSELGQAPCLQLACGHVFHYECLKMKLRNRWAGTRITFGFMECALCKQMINHPALQDELKPILELKEQIKTKALQRLRFIEGDKKVADLNEPSSKWYKNPEGYTMYRFAYFLCFKCKQPYYGGERACEEDRADFDPKELLCGGCSGVPGQEICATHGKEFIEYKCKFCCSTSVFFCWGSTHFCDACHKKAGSIARVPKEELPKCNCNVKHPPNGEEFCFGCSYCRIMQTF